MRTKACPQYLLLVLAVSRIACSIDQDANTHLDAADCDTYCTFALTHCTGANLLYEDLATCDAACADFSTAGRVGDASGNTLQCRLYYLSAAAREPFVFCSHGGADGGDFCK